MLSKQFLAEMKTTLIQQRQELNNKTRQKVDVDTDGDETDEIQGNMLLELTNQFNARDNAKLVQIEEALTKITNSTYGVCEDCDEDIPEKRLLINPHFLTCVFCAEEREVEAKQKKRF